MSQDAATIPEKARDMVAKLSDRVDAMEERIVVLEEAVKAKHQPKAQRKEGN